MFKIAIVIVPALLAAAVLLGGAPGLAPEEGDPEIQCTDWVDSPDCMADAAACTVAAALYGDAC